MRTPDGALHISGEVIAVHAIDALSRAKTAEDFVRIVKLLHEEELARANTFERLKARILPAELRTKGRGGAGVAVRSINAAIVSRSPTATRHHTESRSA